MHIRCYFNCRGGIPQGHEDKRYCMVLKDYVECLVAFKMQVYILLIEIIKCWREKSFDLLVRKKIVLSQNFCILNSLNTEISK